MNSQPTSFDSRLAADVYAWFSHRVCANKAAEPIALSWDALQQQFGCACQARHGGLAAFKKAFREALDLVLNAYPGAQVDELVSGIRILPAPSIGGAGRTI